MKQILSIVALTAICGIAGPLALDASAQVRPGRPGGPGEGRQGADGGRIGPAGRQGLPAGPAQEGGISPMELQQLMDAMVVMQAERDLQLSDEQFPQFLTRLRRLQATRRRAEMDHNRELMELRRLINPNGPNGRNGANGAGGPNGRVDDAQIRERLKALDDIDARAQGEARQARVALDQILDVRQQARFRLLEEQIERRKLDLFARSRQPNPAK